MSMQWVEQPQQQTGTLIVYRTGEALNGPQGVGGPFRIDGMPFLRVFLEGPAAVRARVTIRWWVDEAMNFSMGSDVATTPTGNNTARANFPCRGSWVDFVLEANAYPNAVSFHAFLTQEATSDNTGSNGTNHLIAIDGVAVGAGATSTNDANSTRPGPGFWFAGFDGAAAAGLIRLYMVSMAGALTILDAMGPDLAVNGSGKAIQIPAMPLRITATNGGGVARNLYAGVHYRLPPL